MRNYKEFNHTTATGKEVVIKAWISDRGLINIEVIGEGLTHKYPHTSTIRDGVLYTRYLKYGRNNIAGLKDIPEELEKWYKEAKELLKREEKEKERKEIEEAKKAKDIELLHHTTYGFSSSNAYVSSVLKKLDVKTKKEEQRIINLAEQTDVYMGDYSIETTYKISMKDFEKAIKAIKELRAKQEEAKKEKEIEEIKNKLENDDLPIKNMCNIGTDMSTGIKYYTFCKRVDIDSFNKVRHLFEFIKDGEDDVDMGNGFKGYATRSPDEVANILYPNWREEAREELKNKLQKLQKELQNVA